MMNIEEDAIVRTWFEDILNKYPRFMLFLDHNSKSLVISIRGTASFNDVIIDCVCDQVPFMEGFAHRGILNGAKVVELAVPSIKSALENNPGYDLKVTRHSLGAGTAELVTMQGCI